MWRGLRENSAGMLSAPSPRGDGGGGKEKKKEKATCRDL